MSPTRTELCKWLATIDVKGKTLDIGGKVWSMKGKVKSFEGEYTAWNEQDFDLNSQKEFVDRAAIEKSLNRIGFFDNIFCTEVLQFVYNPFNALDNLYALLPPYGGNLYLSFHLTHPPMKDHDYLRYTEKGIRKLLEVTGFEIQQFSEPVSGYFLVKVCKR